MVCELAPSIGGAAKPVAPPPPPAATCKVVRESVDRDTAVAHLEVPGEQLQRCALYFIMRTRVAAMASAQITLNGKEIPAREGRGSDWAMYSVDLRDWQGQAVEVVLDPGGTDSPFSLPEASIAAWLVMDRAVAAASSLPSEPLPLPISSGFRRQTVELLSETALAGRTNRGSLTAAQLNQIKAAKLRIIVFDSNGEPRYRDKFIQLNGQQLEAVPANVGALSAWQQHVIDLRADDIGRLKVANRLEVTNPAGDYFKFTGLSLAVQLADGTWVETKPNEDVHSSVAQWSHAEGKPFANGRSGVIELRFE
jgi:hypothetical protein